MMKRVPLLLVICSCLLFAQSAPNSVTVTATRSSNLEPDQAVFLVTVATPLDASRDTVVSALQGSGITAAGFYGVQTTQVYNSPTQDYSTLLNWTFTQTSTLADMKSEIGLLSAVQKSIAESGSGFTMSFGLQGVRVSQQAQSAQACSFQDLLSDARAQAQKLASASGASVGSVMAISAPPFVANPQSITNAAAPTCALTVRFQMTGAF